MGLRPERVTDGRSDDARYRLHLGTSSAIIADADAAARDSADPSDPATSSLATSLPRGWRDRDGCWLLNLPDTGSALPSDLRDLFKMIVLLIDLLDASHIFWGAARLWSDAPQFRTSVAEMLVSGMPPVLHLVAFRREGSNGTELIRTRGLALFANQEIEAGVPTGWTTADMVKRLARLAIDLMINGPLREAQRTTGLGPGEVVDLFPPARGNGDGIVRVAFGRSR